MVKKGDYMAEYRVPENQQSNIRKNEQSEIVTAKKAKTCQNILSSSECDMCEDFDMFARVKEEMK